MIVTTLTSVKTANQRLLMVPAMEEGGPPGAPEADVTVPARPPQLILMSHHGEHTSGHNYICPL